MTRPFFCWMLAALVTLAMQSQGAVMAADDETPAALNFKMKGLDGEEVDLADYQGKVVLFVNVASRCGLTPQYKGLQALYEKYADKGLVIIGVPCNQFGSQEPGTDAQIAEFCSRDYGVTFPMLSKVEVNGDGACPLYKYLTSHEKTEGPIKWNFEKFIVGKNGEVIARFAPRTAPDDEAFLGVIEAELKKE